MHSRSHHPRSMWLFVAYVPLQFAFGAVQLADSSGQRVSSGTGRDGGRRGDVRTAGLELLDLHSSASAPRMAHTCGGPCSSCSPGSDGRCSPRMSRTCFARTSCGDLRRLLPLPPTPEDAVRVMSAKSSFMSVLVAFASLTSRAGLSRDANRITHAALPQSFEDFFSQAAKRLEDGWPIISVGQAFKAVR